MFCLLATVWASSESPPDRAFLVVAATMALALTVLWFAVSEQAPSSAVATAEDAFFAPIARLVRWLFVAVIGLQVCGVGVLIYKWGFQ